MLTFSTKFFCNLGSAIDDMSNHHHTANSAGITSNLSNYSHTNHNHLSSNRSNSSSSSPISSQQNLGPNSGPGHGGQQNTNGALGGQLSTNTMHQGSSSGVNFIGPNSSALLVVPQPINATKMGEFTRYLFKLWRVFRVNTILLGFAY